MEKMERIEVEVPTSVRGSVSKSGNVYTTNRRSVSNAWHVYPMTDGLPREKASKRERLTHFLLNRKLHYFMLFLLVLDLALIISGIVLEIQSLDSEVSALENCLEECIHDIDLLPEQCNHPEHLGNQRLHNAERILGYVSLGILSIFIIEHVLMMIGIGVRKFMSHVFYVVDFLVVIVSFVLEIVFQNNPEGGLLIIARLWRFARIFHGFYEIGEDALSDEREWKEELDQYKDIIKEAAEAIESYQDESELIENIKTEFDTDAFKMIVHVAHQMTQHPASIKEHFDAMKDDIDQKEESPESA